MARTHQGATLAVEGFTDLMKAYKTAERDERLGLRKALREVGSIVQRDAARSLSPISARSAAGYKVSVAQRGVGVYQSLKKTTGKRPRWGYFQMRFILLKALFENEQETARAMERVLDQMANHFNRDTAF